MVVYEAAGDAKYQHSLPTVSFREIPDANGPFGVSSDQLKSYGFNDGSDFEQPREYIRYIEPIEKELAGQVEYDMDEQDRAWLDVINAERKKEQSGLISEEVFEIIIDKLEKEWFDLVKTIPQPPSHLPVEDSKCSVCDDGEGENSNAIVFCDGCNLAVHQGQLELSSRLDCGLTEEDCYGVPYIPEGQWLCRKCTVSPENPVSCLFCPNEGGAFKQTTTGHWAHLLCAMWIPELGVGNAIYMEPVEGVETNCSLCREKVGACIQCENRSCFTAFHVTCARQMGLLKSMKSLAITGVLSAYCEKHMPAESHSEYSEDGTASDFSESAPRRKSAAKPRRSSHTGAAVVTTKSARAHAKSYRPGPPIVPRYIVRHILDYIAKMSIRKREPLVERICRYWSLKREARRGAPLLKRLHLEPWTASNASKQQTEAEKAQKLKFLTMLRNDLERVRMLSELVRKREREKLRQIEVIRNLVDDFIFPHNAKLRLALEKISAMDRTDIFKVPVNKTEVPDYYSVITEPMCWTWIDEKIEQNQYRHLVDFKNDVLLTLDNAIKYNMVDSTIYRLAKRIRGNAEPILSELDSQITKLKPDPADESSAVDVGDLEPSSALLHALLASSGSETPTHLLSSIFGFALDPPKPTPPPPTPPPRESKQAKARRRLAEQRRERVSLGRSTRGAKAAELEFIKEAGVADDGPSAAASSSRSRRPAKASESAPKTSGNKPRVGVVAIESFAPVSDKQRREIERGMDLTVDEVDEKQQLLRFNVGWVLPEGTKRHRSGPSASVTPTVSTKPLPRSIKAESSQPPERHDRPASASGRKRPAAKSPATGQRRPSKRSKKDEEAGEVELEAAESSDEDLTSLEDATPRSNRIRRSNSQAQSEIIVDESSAVPGGSGVDAVAKSTASSGDDVDPYPPGTMVWAKWSTFPFFPAEVVDLEDDTEGIAASVLDKQPAEEETAAKGKSWLVRFYDAHSTYAWLRTDRLDMLGEDDEIDQKYLAGRDKKGRGNFKSTSQKNTVRTAYREALADIAGSADEA